MRTKNIFLHILFSLLLVPSLYAQSFFKARESLPKDFAMAAHFYQLKSEQTEESLAQTMRSLDLLLAQLSEEERLMLLKSELYKAHLKLSRGESVRAESYEASSLQLVLKTLNEKKLDPYTRFFLQALSVDLRAITQDSSYPTFLTQWRSGPQNLAPQLQGMKRRMEILLPWVEWLNFNDVEGLERKLHQAVEMAINSISMRIRNYLLMSQIPVPQNLPAVDKMQFFSAVVIEQKKEKGALEGVDKFIEKQGPRDQAVSGWVPRTEPDADYVVPSELPKPVYDWDPKPLDDWLDDL